MKHNNKSIYCDVAHLINGEVDMIYEIYYKHRTADENRPNNIKWVDIDVKDIYDIEINNEKTFPLHLSQGKMPKIFWTFFPTSFLVGITFIWERIFEKLPKET